MTKLGALAKAVKIGISFFALQVKDNIKGMATYRATEPGSLIW